VEEGITALALELAVICDPESGIRDVSDR